MGKILRVYYILDITRSTTTKIKYRGGERPENWKFGIGVCAILTLMGWVGPFQGVMLHADGQIGKKENHV